MIVKNESKYLEECLNALNPILENITSELIIVDTGSTDESVSIARKFTDKVYFHRWNDDFAEARNVTLEKSKGEWFFYIDADEILQDTSDIINFFNTKAHESYRSLSICIKNYVSEDQGEVGSKLYSRRIVRIDNELRFRNKIHEQLPPREPVYESDVVAIHYGYVNNDNELMERKFTRNKTLLEKGLVENPDNTYLLFHLSKTYNLYGDYLEALKIIRKAYQITKKSNVHAIEIYNFMIELCIKNGLFTDAERISKEAIKSQKAKSTALITTQFYLAQSESALKKNKEAISSYNKYLELLNLYKENKLTTNFNEVVIDFGGENFVYSQLIILYDSLFDYENAIKYTKKILETTKNQNDIPSKKIYDNGLTSYVNIAIKYKRYSELIYLYKDLAKELTEEVWKERENNYITAIERQCARNDIKNELINKFAELDVDTNYVFLNRLRQNIKKRRSLSSEDISRIERLDFKNLPIIYSELIYLMIKNSIEISSMVLRWNEKEINRFVSYMLNNFKDFSETVVDYFKNVPKSDDIYYCQFSKALKRAVLIINKVDSNVYFKLFKMYVDEGIAHIEEIYKEHILDQEKIFLLKNEEESFFLFMRKAKLYKNKDDALYVNYLRKALNSYDYMNFGVELLLEEIKKRSDIKTNEEDKSNEFEKYKKVVKQNIEILLDSQKINEARTLIDEYLNILPNDLEMLYLKSKVLLKS